MFFSSGFHLGLDNLCRRGGTRSRELGNVLDAHTTKINPEQNRLYVAIPAVEGEKPAEVQVFEVNP